MTTSTSPQAPSSTSISNGASGASLPRWRLWLQTLNWRRDPGVEQREMQYEQRKMYYEQREMQYEQRKVQHELPPLPAKLTPLQNDHSNQGA
jgi:hypothetical protein